MSFVVVLGFVMPDTDATFRYKLCLSTVITNR